MHHKTEWDLSLIYKGDVAPQIKKDLSAIKKAYLAFAKKYSKDKKHLKNDKALRKAIEDYEALGKNPSGERPYLYYSYKRNLNSGDNEAQAELMKLSNFFTELSNQTEFFMLEIAKIAAPIQKKFLKSKELAPFKYLLKKIFEGAKHQLSEPEEKIMNLKGLPAHGMWVSGFSRLLNKQTVNFQGKDLPVSEASGLIPTLPKAERRELHDKLMEVYRGVSDFAESEMNALLTNKKINDKLRNYKAPYEATVKEYENEAKTVKDLVASVTKNFYIAHKFFKIKAEMLGEEKLFYSDRAAKVGEANIKMPFEEAVSKTISAFNSADSEFGAYVQEMFQNGQVDVFPKKGKTSGAFCSSSSTQPTFVLLNHIEDFRSLTTLAHEMGHALHSKYSKVQRPVYEDYTISVAEVASTFFENLVFEDAMQGLDDKQKMVLLHDKINDDISTIFRQIACFNFENELHETVRKEGFVPKEKIAELMNKHMQSYLGNKFEMKEGDGYFFATWSHIRRFFYVYSYAFGQLVSDSLYEMYKQDKSNIVKIKKFLSAGGSQSPENIFKAIGINPDKKFFEKGLKKIERNIATLEKLWILSKRSFK
jgi:oligoendopeptidase F